MSSPLDNEDYSIEVSSDTITLESSDIFTSSILGPYPSLNVGVGAAGASGTYSIGTSAGSNGTYYTNNTQPWQTITNSGYGSSGTLKVQGDAEFEGKVMINGRNISEFLETISKRLAILVPDPAKLEHFEALKKAYDHYKLLEALCELPKETKE